MSLPNASGTGSPLDGVSLDKESAQPSWPTLPEHVVQAILAWLGPIPAHLTQRTATPESVLANSTAQTGSKSAPASQAVTAAPVAPHTETQSQANAQPVTASQPVMTPPSAQPVTQPPIEQIIISPKVATSAPVENKPSGKSWFSRMKEGLSKSRKNLAEGMANILIGGKEIDDELLEEVETQLLVADIGVDATRTIIQNLTERSARRELIYADALYKALQEELTALLAPKVQPLVIDTTKRPYVILMVGVNGVGKTTTIGKLAKRLQLEGKKVMLAAGDTFRAAATEQLKVWGERNQIPVVAQGQDADSASVIFDALQSAQARDIDVLIADTAGRLHTKSNLMEELAKVRRVLQKIDPDAPHEVMIVVDAGTGQNALNQVQQFNDAIGLTGITVTKLDGTAKGGVLFNIAQKTNIPIRFIGVGESIDDLQPFEAASFVKALFQTED